MTTRIDLTQGVGFDIETHETDDQWISHAIRTDWMWAADETGFILDTLKPGQTFIDIGANIGWFTLMASRIVGDAGKVVAYEPDPRNYEMLSRNIQRNGMTNVTAYEMAIDTRDRTGTLYRSATNQGDHRLFDAHPTESRDGVTVRAVNPSIQWFTDGIKPDFIKCDTQGYESRVFTAIAEYIARLDALPTLLIEYWPNGIKAAGGCPSRLIELLTGIGYDIRNMVGVIQTDDMLRDTTSRLFDDPNYEAHINLICTE